jgi:hypothetical protein
MRALEFITEASIFTKPERYSFGHKVNVSGGKKGAALDAAIKTIVPDFDPSEELEWVAKATRNVPTALFGNGGGLRYFKRPNGQIFAVNGADKAIQSGLTHAKGQKGSTAENKGDLSEPVLSAAVVAKLIKRGTNSVDDIEEDDVKRVLLAATKDPTLKFVVKDKGSKVADTIEFFLKIRGPSMEYLKSPEFWQSYNLLSSAVHYANSGQIDRYADYFYKNGKADKITIDSDGMSAQKERKTDITAFVNGRPLKNLNISLKAGSPHIGQVGGGQIDKPTSPTGVISNAQRLFGPFGVEVPTPKKITSKVNYWVSAYKAAAKQLKAALAGQDARSEAGIIYKIAELARTHGTSGDANIKLVSLIPGGLSSIHSFKNLERKLTAGNIDLYAEYREGSSKVSGEPRPEIRIIDKTSGKPLMYFRYSSTEAGDKVWNTIEMRELLKQLTTLNYQKATPAQQPPAQQPVSQQPVAQVPVQQPSPAVQQRPVPAIKTRGSKPINPTAQPMGPDA